MSVQAHLVITNVSPATWRASVFLHPQTIGRDAENDIVIPASYLSVSRRHAQIRVDRDKHKILVQDLNSTGGTHLNGIRLEALQETQLVIGDRLLLADLQLVVLSVDAPILEQPCKTPTTIMFDLPKSSIIVTGRGESDSPDSCRLKTLTRAELQVVWWVARGVTTLEGIGERLFRSPETVRTQLNKIFLKLNVHSREALLAWLVIHEISWTAAHKVDAVGDSSSSQDTSHGL